MADWLRNKLGKASFADEPETATLLSAVTLLREDAKALALALHKHKQSTESSIESGLMDMGLGTRDLGAALVLIAGNAGPKKASGVAETRTVEALDEMKHTAHTLGEALQRAADARSRAAARSGSYLTALIADMERAYQTEVKPLKKLWGKRKAAAEASTAAAAREAKRLSQAPASASASPPFTQAVFPTRAVPPEEDWRATGAMLRLKSSELVIFFAPKVSSALRAFALGESASYAEVAHALQTASHDIVAPELRISTLSCSRTHTLTHAASAGATPPDPEAEAAEGSPNQHTKSGGSTHSSVASYESSSSPVASPTTP